MRKTYFYLRSSMSIRDSFFRFHNAADSRSGAGAFFSGIENIFSDAAALNSGVGDQNCDAGVQRGIALTPLPRALSRVRARASYQNLLPVSAPRRRARSNPPRMAGLRVKQTQPTSS